MDPCWGVFVLSTPGTEVESQTVGMEGPRLWRGVLLATLPQVRGWAQLHWRGPQSEISGLRVGFRGLGCGRSSDTHT